MHPPREPSLILVAAGFPTPKHSCPRKGLTMSGAVASWGDSPDDVKRTSGNPRQATGLLASGFSHTQTMSRPSLTPSTATASRAEGLWEHGRGSAYNPGNAVWGDLASGGLSNLVLTWLFSTWSPTSEHEPSISAISSHPVTRPCASVL